MDDEKEYKVRFYQDDDYEVVEAVDNGDPYEFYYEQVFKGSLSDCEAYIRLKEKGYM